MLLGVISVNILNISSDYLTLIPFVKFQVPVGHPSEIDEIFDDISYNKGASVIRMLHKYIGDEVRYRIL